MSASSNCTTATTTPSYSHACVHTHIDRCTSFVVRTNFVPMQLRTCARWMWAQAVGCMFIPYIMCCVSNSRPDSFAKKMRPTSTNCWTPHFATPPNAPNSSLGLFVCSPSLCFVFPRDLDLRSMPLPCNCFLVIDQFDGLGFHSTNVRCRT